MDPLHKDSFNQMAAVTVEAVSQLINAACVGDVAKMGSLFARHGVALVKARPPGGRNGALIQAAEFGQEQALLWLLDHGAELEACNKGGRTALMAAARGGRLNTLRILLERGADPNRPDDGGRGALFFALGHGFELIDALMDYGAQIDLRHGNNWTPLEQAQADDTYAADAKHMLYKKGQIDRLLKEDDDIIRGRGIPLPQQAPPALRLSPPAKIKR